jgi:hypothetical protein
MISRHEFWRSGAVISLALGAAMWAGAASADQVILDDLIVDGSACVGFDCVNGENFGSDTLRLKEINLRVHFNDTSNAASFPNNDWRIIINDSANGGANYFAIDDVSGSRTPFRIDAGAPTNSLRVDSGGDVGIGTATPVVDLHVRSGNTPTLRLEQDGSSGFTPQTWDVAGNEANFFIRDATNGSALPIRIEPGTASNTLYLDNQERIGIGTTSPEGKLHILGGTSNTALILEQTGTVAAKWQLMNNAGSGRLMMGIVGGNTPFKIDEVADTNLLQLAPGGVSNRVRISGNLVVTGQCTETDGPCADYVFEPGYEKLSLEELKAFVTANKHLPNVPSADEMKKNGVDVTHLSGRLLEKIEELVLYTFEQQGTIEQLQARIAMLEETNK